MIGSPFERARGDDCLSDLAIDRLAGEREMHPHLDGCAACAARFRELEQDRDRFAARSRPLRSRSLLRAVTIALAASVAALIVWPKGTDVGFRSKGGPELRFYVKHGEQVRRGSDGEIVAPKDAIRFAYTSERSYHLAVFSLDPNGKVSVYYPDAGGTRAELPGAEVALPLSTVLDDSVGPERIWGLFCEGPIDLSSVKQRIASSREAPAIAGCLSRRIEWKKQP